MVQVEMSVEYAYNYVYKLKCIKRICFFNTKFNIQIKVLLDVADDYDYGELKSFSSF